MAILGYPLQPGRETSSQKAYVLIPRGGQVHAQAWPRKRGPRRQDYMRAQCTWLAAVVRMYKRVDARVTTATREAADLTRLRPQDRFTHVQSGRAWLITDPDLGRVYPRRFLYCVSAAIDACAAGPGALLVRGADQWRPLVAGRPGAYLTIKAGLPAWSDGTMVDNTSPNNAVTTGVSQSLDVIGSTPGSLALRGVEFWTIVEPGEEGDVLTINNEGWPSWQSR